MMKKILYIAIILFSAFMYQNALPQIGVKGLINGITANNSVRLLAADFLYISAVLFSKYGVAQKYICGFGKYKITRFTKRQTLLRSLIAKALGSSIAFTVIRFLVYSILLLWKVQRIFDVKPLSIINWIVLSIMITLFICLLQMLVEIRFSSTSSLLVCFTYYILSVILDGYLIENKKSVFAWLLPINFNMKYRSAFIPPLYLYLSLLILNFTVIMLLTKVIKEKDIF
ncbi:MAG: DUF2705 family protein [Ruminococcus sp.]|nr:DUF2705 family protein [Ruminococcus sp.]